MPDTPKGGSCWQLTFAPAENYPAGLVDFIDDYFTTSGLDYNDDGTETLSVYAGLDFNENDFRTAADARGLTLPPYTLTRLESTNWLKDYVISFAPVETADFLIYGIHEKNPPQTDKIPLQIYAATAFGSEHPTTRGCLEALCRLNRRHIAHNNILDMGCGSGILSVGAAALWPDSARITAVDIDDEAVIVTLQNAADNHFQNQINAYAGNGYNTPAVSQNAPYDLVLSNILARPLIEMSPALFSVLKSGGFCILSGFTADQHDWVVSAHRQQGLVPVQSSEIDNWCTVVMEKTK